MRHVCGDSLHTLVPVCVYSVAVGQRVCVCVCVCAERRPGPVSATFGPVSGRVCRNDAAAGSALLCNPPTSLKHHHSFIIKPRINVGVCTTTTHTHTHSTCMNARVISHTLPSSSMSCIRIRQSGGTLRNKHFLSRSWGKR